VRAGRVRYPQFVTYEPAVRGGNGGLGAPPSAIKAFGLVTSGGNGGLGAPPSAIKAFGLVTSGGNGGLGAPPSAIEAFGLVTSGGNGGLGAPPSAIVCRLFVRQFAILARGKDVGVGARCTDSNNVAA
jgi:hypothetical protein